MSRARQLIERAGASGTPVWRIAGRVALSEARRRVPGQRMVAVPLDDRGTLIRADLSRPFGLSLYRYGFPEPEACLVQRLLRPGDVFVDGGAHIGVFTLLAAAIVGESGRVVSCEPVPENLELLKANLELNRFAWVDAHMVALGERTGTADLFSFGEGSALSSYAPATRAGARRVVVEVRTLDDLTIGFGSRVRLVKLDVEGAEVLAMRGGSRLLQAKPDFLLELEPEHLARQNTTVEELEHLFTDAGYRAFGIKKNGPEVVLVPMKSWRRPSGNPNVLASARPDLLSVTMPALSLDR